MSQMEKGARVDTACARSEQYQDLAKKKLTRPTRLVRGSNCRHIVTVHRVNVSLRKIRGRKCKKIRWAARGVFGKGKYRECGEPRNNSDVGAQMEGQEVCLRISLGL
jgi:hypothetical protein